MSSTQVLPPNTIDLIDLTNELDSPPPSPRRTAHSDDPEIQYIGGNVPNLGVLRLPPLRRPVYPQRPASTRDAPIVVDDDEDELIVLDQDVPGPAFRIFSPPARFAQPPPLRSRDPTAERPEANGEPPVPPPRIGLGGGFLAFRDREPPARYHSEDVQRRAGNNAPAPRPRPSIATQRRNRAGFVDFLAGLIGGRGEIPPDEREFMHHHLGLPFQGAPVDFNLPPLGMVWDAGQPRDRPFGPVPWAIAPANEPPLPGATPKSTYSHTMTHPSAVPRPGFTYDFDPSATSASAPMVIDDSNVKGASSSAPAATKKPPTLICARCDQPLKIGSRTMWGLRCGHVICGSCADYLGHPVSEKKEEPEVKKEVEIEEALTPKVDLKGKGKAVLFEEEMSLSRKRGGRRAKTTAQPASRQLRSSTMQATARSVEDSPSKPGPSSKKRKRPLKKPRVVEEYEYMCPVDDCLRPHWSVKWFDPIEETFTWKPKEDVGAIPIFT